MCEMKLFPLNTDWSEIQFYAPWSSIATYITPIHPFYLYFYS